MSLAPPPDPLARGKKRPLATGDVTLSDGSAPPTASRQRLSPLNQRRWRNFKANRRGFWSFWIFSVLFLISLFAEVIANDRPLLLKYDGRFYVPVLFSYSETTFGGDFETSADYRDPYLQKLIAEKGGWMLWPPIRYHYQNHNP